MAIVEALTATSTNNCILLSEYLRVPTTHVASQRTNTYITTHYWTGENILCRIQHRHPLSQTLYNLPSHDASTRLAFPPADWSRHASRPRKAAGRGHRVWQWVPDRVSGAYGGANWPRLGSGPHGTIGQCGFGECIHGRSVHATVYQIVVFFVFNIYVKPFSFQIHEPSTHGC